MATGSITSGTAVYSQIKRQGFLDSLYCLSPLQTALEQYERMARPSALEMVMEQQERWDRLIKGPARPSTLQMVMEQRANIDRLMAPSIFEQLTRQQRLFEELVEGPKIATMLAGWSGAPPMGLVEQVEHYRDDLLEEVGTEGGEAAIDEGALSRLAAEREAILTCLDRVGKSMVAAGLLGVPIPDVVLGLIVAFIVIGEVADEILSDHVKADAA